MKYRDEFHIASTAILLSAAMFGISVVVPKESRVPTAKTTLVEAPETAAEAEAAAEEQSEFPIYSQESNYDDSSDSSQDYSEPDTSGDSSDSADGGDSSGSDQITYPSEDTGDGSGDTSGGDTVDIPDYTENPGDGYAPSEDDNWDYIDPGTDSGADGSDSSDSSQQDMEIFE